MDFRNPELDMLDKPEQGVQLVAQCLETLVKYEAHIIKRPLQQTYIKLEKFCRVDFFCFFSCFVLGSDLFEKFFCFLFFCDKIHCLEFCSFAKFYCVASLDSILKYVNFLKSLGL